MIVSPCIYVNVKPNRRKILSRAIVVAPPKGNARRVRSETH